MMAAETYTCVDHTEMATGYIGWHAQADWFKARGYKQRRCGECNLWAVVLAPDGRRVESFGGEFEGKGLPAEGDESPERHPMTRPGWVQCSRCSGTAVETVFVGNYGGSVDCPDCVGGEVPGDELVEAAADAIWKWRHPDTPYRPGRARHNEYHADYLRDATAALIAARRWEEQ